MKRCFGLLFGALFMMSGSPQAQEQKVEWDLAVQCVESVVPDRDHFHCLITGTPDNPTGVICDPLSFIVNLKKTVKFDSCISAHIVKDSNNAKAVRSNEGQVQKRGDE